MHYFLAKQIFVFNKTLWHIDDGIIIIVTQFFHASIK